MCILTKQSLNSPIKQTMLSIVTGSTQGRTDCRYCNHSSGILYLFAPQRYHVTRANPDKDILKRLWMSKKLGSRASLPVEFGSILFLRILPWCRPVMLLNSIALEQTVRVRITCASQIFVLYCIIVLRMEIGLLQTSCKQGDNICPHPHPTPDVLV